MQDDILIDKLLDSDQDAARYMVKAYGKLLWVVVGGVLGKIGTTQDIEECISDVYFQIWQNPRAFNQQKGTFKTFVMAASEMVNGSAADALGMEPKPRPSVNVSASMLANSTRSFFI